MIGLKPDIIWECTNNICKTTYVNKNISKVVDKKNNPLENLKEIIKTNKTKIPEILPSISCGLFGYLGYEMIQYFENINLTKKDSLNLPESIFIRPSITLVFDNVNDKLFVTKIVSKR